ncbi:MAG: putative 2OG-Fe(II) oxygenase [Bacteroidetes bacterium]|nr:putative 2OG-Fe(II) oxygenase [Bacteroidota bacterium]
MANITKWFGRAIYITVLDNFEEINKEIIPLINSEVTPTNSQYARTTDIKPNELQSIDDGIHHDKRFNNLFDAIIPKIKEALISQHINLDVLDMYITKAWTTFTIKEQYIHSHRHMSSHYSFVYYPYAEGQGDLVFQDDGGSKVGLNIPIRKEYFTEFTDINYSSAIYPAKTGNLIIFPSMLFHETQLNTTDKPRISISGDIMLTMKEGVKSEHNIPSPATWKKI